MILDPRRLYFFEFQYKLYYFSSYFGAIEGNALNYNQWTIKRCHKLGVPVVLSEPDCCLGAPVGGVGVVARSVDGATRLICSLFTDGAFGPIKTSFLVGLPSATLVFFISPKLNLSPKTEVQNVFNEKPCV